MKWPSSMFAIAGWAFSFGFVGSAFIRGFVRGTTSTTSIGRHLQLNWQPAKQRAHTPTSEITASSDIHDDDNTFRPGGPISTSKTIRSWGCNLTTTPFVFVHIGKSGGGDSRMRLAAASTTFNPEDKNAWKRGEPMHYRIMVRTATGVGNSSTRLTQVRRAQLRNSKSPHYYPEKFRTFEGTWPCSAQTPIGQMLSCWSEMHSQDLCQEDSDYRYCDTVYLGHNVMGNEVHWLSAPILQSWRTEIMNSHTDKMMEDMEMHNWIVNRKSLQRFRQGGLTEEVFAKSFEISKEADVFAQRWFRSNHEGVDWSYFYSSLPVVRATVIREPFSWLLSKFFWHFKTTNVTCDDVSNATMHAGLLQRHASEIMEENDVNGWAVRFALEYVMYLCGEDCVARYHHGSIRDLRELEAQAEGNLRRSFAVVALLNESDSFNEMVHRRMAYLPTLNHLQSKGSKHRSKASNDCKLIYQNETFQRELMNRSPEIAMLNRLYNVAVEVNRYQKAELETCR